MLKCLARTWLWTASVSGLGRSWKPEKLTLSSGVWSSCFRRSKYEWCCNSVVKSLYGKTAAQQDEKLEDAHLISIAGIKGVDQTWCCKIEIRAVFFFPHPRSNCTKWFLSRHRMVIPQWGLWEEMVWINWWHGQGPLVGYTTFQMSEQRLGSLLLFPCLCSLTTAAVIIHCRSLLCQVLGTFK